MNEDQTVEAGTPCEQGGPEHTPIRFQVKEGQRVEWNAWICFANAHVRLWLRRLSDDVDQLLVDVQDQSHIRRIIVPPADAPTLPPDEYELRWRIETASADWQTRVEVLSGDLPTMRYRRRRRSGDDQGINRGSVELGVRP